MLNDKSHGQLKNLYFTIKTGDTIWEHKAIEDFIDEYRKKPEEASVNVNYDYHVYNIPHTFRFTLVFYNDDFGVNTVVTVEDERDIKPHITRVFSLLDDALETSLVVPTKINKVSPVIFIGHGGSLQWRNLKDHLVDQHGYKVEAYETGARGGHTIRDILDDMLNNATFALLVLTAEDEMKGGEKRARQNVIHETGLFQGKLGFSRAIVLLEEGAEEFSNIYGIQQLRFKKDNIKETFGDVLAILKREFNT
ncbi:hypothetical protein GCM10011375_40730 [Hymenobacter qilianensis]|nr:hypothetical protein GCM10011375_40730 [Hymenobacter qilianensis]